MTNQRTITKGTPPEHERQQYLEKPLPSAPEAERIIIGAMFLDHTLLFEAASLLVPNDFYSPLNRRVYQAMLWLADKAEKEIKAFERQASKFVLQLMVDTAPVGKDGKPLVAPAHIDRVFSVLQDVVKSGAVEFEGEQIPMTAAALIVDSSVVEENEEMNKRRKQALGQEIEDRKARLNGEQVNKKTSGKTAADLVAGLGEDEAADEAPAMTVPQLLTTCTAHGGVHIYSFMHGGVRLTCGCVFKRYDEGMLFEGNEPLTEDELAKASEMVHVKAVAA